MEDIKSVWLDKSLDQIPGIGKAIQAKIDDYFTSGSIHQLEDALIEAPKEIFEMLSVQGLGPKSIALAYKELKVETLEDLIQTIENGSLAKLPGMGEKKIQNIKESIGNKTKDILLKLDLTKVDIDDLTLVQSVQPAKRYKPNQDGSMSTFGKRVIALEKLLGYPIKNRIKIKFVVTKKPLPGISKPSKSGVKPIDYMYPVELLKNSNEIDLGWYKKMIENYIQGAFGLSNVAMTEQTGLDAWM